MIILPDRQEHKLVRSAIKEAGRASAEDRREAFSIYDVRLGLFAHGDEGNSDELSERMSSATWEQSAIPITLDATISGSLPARLQDARLSLFAEVRGIPIPQLFGQKTAFLPSQNAYSSDILSSSTGSLLAGEDAVKLGEFTEYEGATPQQVVYDIARRLPYDQHHVNIEPIKGVSVTYSGSGESPGFLAHEATGDVLDRLSELQTAGYAYHDTTYNGLRARVVDQIRKTDISSEQTYQDAPGFRSYDATTLPGWNMQRPQPPALRFSAVRVYHQDENGRLLYEVIEEVPYAPFVRKPHKNRTLEIAYEDASEAGPENARARAIREAARIANSIYEGDGLVLPVYDPLIEVLDPMSVEEFHRDDDGLWHMLWAMRTETYRHIFGGNSGGAPGGAGGGNGRGAGENSATSLETVLGYTSALIQADKLAVPDLIVPGRTPGTHLTTRPSYGVDQDALYFDKPLLWVAAEGDDLIFYDNSAGRAVIVGDDITVSS